ncbi:MAG TPA: regulatory protein RecX [Acidiferrobacterales bacterium]
MLARREHSRAELTAKLIQKGYDEELVGGLVAALAAEGLVSDERFVEALVSVRRGRGFGPLRIRQELQDKGVAEELVDRWVDAGDRDWIEQLQRVRVKKFGTMIPKGYAERARQARFLQQRGFPAEQIRRVLNADDLD